jgi:hypothetical protein
LSLAFRPVTRSAENVSVLLFGRHYYKEYEEFKIPDFEQKWAKLPVKH